MRASIALVVLAGCYRTELEHFEPSGKPGHPGHVELITASTLLWGLVPQRPVDVATVCGDAGVWSISTRYTGLSFLCNVVTVGIYVPMYARVTCRGDFTEKSEKPPATPPVP